MASQDDDYLSMNTYRNALVHTPVETPEKLVRSSSNPNSLNKEDLSPSAASKKLLNSGLRSQKAMFKQSNENRHDQIKNVFTEYDVQKNRNLSAPKETSIKTKKSNISTPDKDQVSKPIKKKVQFDTTNLTEY